MTYIRYLTIVFAALCLFADNALSQTAPRAPAQTQRAPQRTERAPQQTPPAAQQTPANVAPGPDDVWTIPDRDRINEGRVTVITVPSLMRSRSGVVQTSAAPGATFAGVCCACARR